MIADKHKLLKTILRLDYTRYKKGVPLKRNDKMVNMADEVLVVWDGKKQRNKTYY